MLGVSTATDSAVIEASWREPDLLAVLFQRYAVDVHRYTFRRVGPDLADDLVAATLEPRVHGIQALASKNAGQGLKFVYVTLNRPHKRHVRSS